MLSNLSIELFLNSLFALMGVIILFFLIKNSRHLQKYIPLLVFVILYLIEFFLDFLTTNYPNQFSGLLYLTEPFAMLYGVLIYLYARNQLQAKLILKKQDLLLLIPFFLAILSYLPYYLLPASIKLLDYQYYGKLTSDISENIWEWNFEVILNASFLIMALKELKKYTSKIKEQLSDIQRYDLHLSQLLIKLNLGLYFFEFLFVYLTLYGFPYYEQLFLLLRLLSVGIVFLIGYDAIISNKYTADLIPIFKHKQESKEVKYAKSNLSNEDVERIKNQLEQCMQEQELYLQPQLRIKDLEEQLKVPTHQLSQVINQAFDQNFYEFVNHYRVQYALQILSDSNFSKYTYTAIGFEAGFNSKSAFYNAFKKVTGKTPAQMKGSE